MNYGNVFAVISQPSVVKAQVQVCSVPSEVKAQVCAMCVYDMVEKMKFQKMFNLIEEEL